MASPKPLPDSDPPPLLDATVAAPPRRRVWPLLFFFFVTGVVGYFAFATVNGVVNTNTVEARVVAMRQEIAALEWEAEQLGALAAYLDSDEFIERVAREELGLVRPGEEAFAISAPPRPGLAITRSPWWANLLPERTTTVPG